MASESIAESWIVHRQLIASSESAFGNHVLGFSLPRGLGVVERVIVVERQVQERPTTSRSIIPRGQRIFLTLQKVIPYNSTAEVETAELGS